MPDVLPSLFQQLARIAGKKNVSRAPEDLHAYSYDASDRRGRPLGVVFPETEAQVSAIMALAHKNRLPVIPRGAGSGLTGGCIATGGGLVMVMAAFNRIIHIDAANLTAEVEPGVVTRRLQAEAEKQGLFYPPDPASRDFSQMGGNIAENAGGMTAVKYGVTRNYVKGLRVVLPDGRMADFGARGFARSGPFDATPLFVGSEGTLGVITRAWLRLLPLPRSRRTVCAAFPTVAAAAATVPDIIKNRIVPSALEFMDRHCIFAVEKYLNAGLPAEAGAFLLIEVDGDPEMLDVQTVSIREVAEKNRAMEIRIARTEQERDRLWELRRAITAALAIYSIRGNGEDIVVPRTKIPDIIAAMDEIADELGLFTINFGHAGDGNLHVSLAEKAGPVPDQNVEQAEYRILEATVKMGGRIAAEHGIGCTKNKKIGLNIDPATLKCMQLVKNHLDPRCILNPGKVFP